MDALNVVFEFSFLPPPLGNVEGRNSIRLRSAWNSAWNRAEEVTKSVPILNRK